MITIDYYRSGYRVIVEGHAGAAPKGHDIVCAAASALAYTLAANVDSLFTSGCAEEPSIVLEDGDADISCKPKPGMEAVAMLILDTVCTGFEMLSLRYPEYVSFRTHE